MAQQQLTPENVVETPAAKAKAAERQQEPRALVKEFRARLKPCPLCGQRPQIEENALQDWLVRCTCGLYFLMAEGERDKALNRAAAEHAVELWNHRANVRK